MEMKAISGWTLRWILNFAAVLTTAWIIPGFVLGIWGAIVGGGFLSFVNALIRTALAWLQPDWKISALVTLAVNLLAAVLTVMTIKGVEVTGLGGWISTVLLLSVFSFIISQAVDYWVD
jgi:hypothetical protein